MSTGRYKSVDCSTGMEYWKEEYWNGLNCSELPCSEARTYLFITYFVEFLMQFEFYEGGEGGGGESEQGKQMCCMGI